MADPVRPLMAVAAAEGAGAAAMTVGVAWATTRPEDHLSTGWAEVLLWLVLSAAITLVWFGLYRRRRAARAPFLLVQAFGLVIAWTFTQADVLGWRVIGLCLGVLALAGLVLSLRPALGGALH